MERAIVLLSGGIDSAVALHHARGEGWEVHPLTFHYHQRPHREVQATLRLAEGAGCRERLIEVDLPFLMEVEDLLAAGVDNRLLKDAPPTYVPGRNLVFYSLAAHYAEVRGARWIVGGHNDLDPDTFPDATPAFFRGLNRLLASALATSDGSPVEIVNPLHGMSKVDVLRRAVELDVPLDATWSCSHDEAGPCGVCFPCQQRAEAFALLGRQDPLVAAERAL